MLDFLRDNNYNLGVAESEVKNVTQNWEAKSR